MTDVIERLHNAVREDQNAVMYCVRLQDLINEASAELERLRTENEVLEEGLTASYMLGSENGKEAAKAEIAELKQERDRLRVAGSYMSNVLYNFKQRKDIPEQDRVLMAKWQTEWDRTVKGEEA